MRDLWPRWRCDSAATTVKRIKFVMSLAGWKWILRIVRHVVVTESSLNAMTHSQSTSGHIDFPPKPQRWTTAVASAAFAVTTVGPPKIPPGVTDCSIDRPWRMEVQQKSAEV